MNEDVFYTLTIAYTGETSDDDYEEVVTGVNKYGYDNESSLFYYWKDCAFSQIPRERVISFLGKRERTKARGR